MSRLSLDAAFSAKKLSPWSILGLVLVPLILGATLVWGLWSPTDRLEQMTGAIVNDDKPVTLNGQVTPLGRLLAGGLVDSGTDQNLTWVITNEEDAKAGLADGSYATVVTIPENFSAAATSFSGDAAKAEKATLDIATSPKSKLVDAALTQTVTSTASTVLGQQLTETYIDNLYVGFNTLGDQLGEAATGATSLADGANKLGDGAQQVASGVEGLGAGLGTLSSGASSLSSGVASLSTGARSLSTGATGLQTGASTLSNGLTEFAGGLDQTAAGLTELPGALTELSGITNTAATTQTAALGTDLATLGAQLTALQEGCVTPNDNCAAIGAALTQFGKVAASSTSVLTSVGYADAYVNGQGGQPGLATQLSALPAGIGQAATAAHQLADGATQLTGGASQLATGASSLASGASQAATGASGLATGAASAGSGAQQLAQGANELATGTSSLSQGATSLGTGLTQASGSLPSTNDSERKNLSSVVANPVTTDGAQAGLFDASSIPFFAMLALWVGGLVSFLLLRAVPRRAMTAAQSVFKITGRGVLPGLLIGAAQGVLIAGVMQVALGLSAADWLAFAGISVLAGVAFGAVNQGLVAAFGGFGRLVSMIITVLALAAGIVSTVPPVYDQVLAVLPLTTALNGMRAVVEGTGGVGSSVSGLIGWLILGCALTLVAVLRERSLGVSAIPQPRVATA